MAGVKIFITVSLSLQFIYYSQNIYVPPISPPSTLFFLFLFCFVLFLFFVFVFVLFCFVFFFFFLFLFNSMQRFQCMLRYRRVTLKKIYLFSRCLVSWHCINCCTSRSKLKYPIARFSFKKKKIIIIIIIPKCPLREFIRMSTIMKLKI